MNAAAAGETCNKKVGSKPYWMGVDQYDPCRCLLFAGHNGPCQCSHDATLRGDASPPPSGPDYAPTGGPVSPFGPFPKAGR